MAKKKIFHVLGACRQLLRILNKFKKKIDWRVPSFDAFVTAIIYIVLFGFHLLIVSFIWFCFNRAFDLVETSLAVSFSIGTTVSMLCFVSMIKNEQLINETIDKLQNIVEQRRCIPIILYINFWNYF